MIHFAPSSMALLDIGAFTVFILLHLRLFSPSLP